MGGYREWPVFFWHLDSILLYQAEGAGALFSSLVKRGIPFLSDAELRQVHSRIGTQARSQLGPLFNGPKWGMADVDLPERMMHAA